MKFKQGLLRHPPHCSSRRRDAFSANAIGINPGNRSSSLAAPASPPHAGPLSPPRVPGEPFSLAEALFVFIYPAAASPCTSLLLLLSLFFHTVFLSFSHSARAVLYSPSLPCADHGCAYRRLFLYIFFLHSSIIPGRSFISFVSWARFVLFLCRHVEEIPGAATTSSLPSSLASFSLSFLFFYQPSVPVHPFRRLPSTPCCFPFHFSLLSPLQSGFWRSTLFARRTPDRGLVGMSRRGGGGKPTANSICMRNKSRESGDGGGEKAIPLVFSSALVPSLPCRFFFSLVFPLHGLFIRPSPYTRTHTHTSLNNNSGGIGVAARWL